MLKGGDVPQHFVSCSKLEERGAVVGMRSEEESVPSPHSSVDCVSSSEEEGDSGGEEGGPEGHRRHPAPSHCRRSRVEGVLGSEVHSQERR